MILIWLLAKKAVEVVYTALYFSIQSLIQTLVIFYYFDPYSSLFQFFLSTPFISFFGNTESTFLLGVDGISLWLIWLVNILMPIVILSSYKAIPDNRIRQYILQLILIGFWSNAVFMVLDLLLFYISFEGDMLSLTILNKMIIC